LFNYGQHPQADPFQVKNVDSHVVQDLATHLANIHKELTIQLHEAEERYKDYADCHHQFQSKFKSGDCVPLLRRKIHNKPPLAKLDY